MVSAENRRIDWCRRKASKSGVRSQAPRIEHRGKPVNFPIIFPICSPQTQSASAEVACGRFVMSEAGDETRQATRQVSDRPAFWPGLSLKTLPSQQGPWKVQQNRLAWAGSIWTTASGPEPRWGWQVSTGHSSQQGSAWLRLGMTTTFDFLHRSGQPHLGGQVREIPS